MNFKNAFLFLVSLLLISCSNDHRSTDNIFDSNIEYESIYTEQQILFDNIFQPRKIRIIDDLLLVSDFQNVPPFHILKIGENGDLEYMKGGGVRGEGLDEFELIEDFINADSLIYIYDGAQLKLVSYDKKGEPAPYNDIHLRLEGRAITMNALSDERFIAVGIILNNRFQVFDKSGEITGSYGEQIVYDENFTPGQIAGTWYSFSVTHVQKNLVALFVLNADLIELYRGDGELLKTVQGEEYPHPVRRLENVNGQTFPVDIGSKAAYLWVDADDHYIYALYMDQIRTEMEQLSASKIHILDWDLNLVRAVELDHQTSYLAADKNGGIYTSKYVDEGTEFRYQRIFNE